MSNSGNRHVLEPDAVEFVRRYGISYPDFGLAGNAEQAAEIGERIGLPVALKIVSPDVVHKTDVGGVALDLIDRQQVEKGYRQMMARVQEALPDAHLRGAIVCRQADAGMELIAGAIQDPVFGPTVMVGLGGVFTELIHDVSFRIAPLKRIDAEEMIAEMKGSKLLRGIRGGPAGDIESLIDLLLNVSRLMIENSNIRELDLNPVRLYARGLLALDVRMLVAEKS